MRRVTDKLAETSKAMRRAVGDVGTEDVNRWRWEVSTDLFVSRALSVGVLERRKTRRDDVVPLHACKRGLCDEWLGYRGEQNLDLIG